MDQSSKDQGKLVNTGESESKPPRIPREDPPPPPAVDHVQTIVKDPPEGDS